MQLCGTAQGVLPLLSHQRDPGAIHRCAGSLAEHDAEVLRQLLQAQQELLAGEDARGGHGGVAFRPWNFRQADVSGRKSRSHKAAALELVDEDILARPDQGLDDLGVQVREEGIERGVRGVERVVFIRIHPSDRMLNRIPQDSP